MEEKKVKLISTTTAFFPGKLAKRTCTSVVHRAGGGYDNLVGSNWFYDNFSFFLFIFAAKSIQERSIVLGDSLLFYVFCTT